MGCVCAVVLVAVFLESLRYVSKCITVRYPGYFRPDENQ